MKVVNKRKEPFTVYIGRGSIFGNPFIMGKDGDRDQVVEKYREYALNDNVLMMAIAKLPENAVLGCFCAPLRCHGQIIIEMWKNMKKD
jgi:hypothetical protein